MFLSGVQFRIRLDSRLKHAGMTVFGKKINLTQQAAGNMTRSDSNNCQSDLLVRGLNARGSKPVTRLKRYLNAQFSVECGVGKNAAAGY
jgi:hypothetical protein